MPASAPGPIRSGRTSFSAPEASYRGNRGISAKNGYSPYENWVFAPTRPAGTPPRDDDVTGNREVPLPRFITGRTSMNNHPHLACLRPSAVPFWAVVGCAGGAVSAISEWRVRRRPVALQHRFPGGSGGQTLGNLQRLLLPAHEQRPRPLCHAAPCPHAGRSKSTR